MFVFSSIDRYLNGITMYRLVLYVLTFFAAAAILLSSFGILSYSPISLVASLAILIAISWAANEVFAALFKVPSNTESSYITAFILFFVLIPPSSLRDALWLALAAFIAMASKYVLAWRAQHVVNPAALAAVVVGIPTGLAAWWIAMPWMFPIVLIGSLLVVRKVRRFQLFFTVILSGAVVASILGVINDVSVTQALQQFFFSWPVVFFAAIMVTEPFTAPGTARGRFFYALGIGAFSSWPFHIGPVFSTPEFTLVIANLIAFPFGLRRRLILTLSSREEIARDTHAFYFEVTPQPQFKAGQYLEWTLPHANADMRGLRRYFTIASSPTEDRLQIGVKFFADGSSFKKQLLALEPGARMYGAIRGGDFVLPEDKNEKLVFIAGGIGVTPFRSMIKQLIDTHDARDITLFYASKTWPEVAYRSLLAEAAEKINLKTVYVLNDTTGAEGVFEEGFITADILGAHVSDPQNRTFYLSGPDAMVQSYKKLLAAQGVTRIRTDYFPGF